jgi:glucokinase
MAYRIGFDMGGTKLLAVLFDDDFGFKGSVKYSTPANTNEKGILDLIDSMIEQLIKKTEVDQSDIESIGIAVPGIVDHNEGKIINLTNIGLKDVYLKKKMEEDIPSSSRT